MCTRPFSVTLFITAFSLAVPTPSPACQYDECHTSGAVSAPAGWDIRLPFEAGETVQILSGYGPYAGSSLHCRSQDSVCANDYYALDFVLPNHPDSGRGRPVLAIADGVVWDAGWGSEGWANYGQRVYILHDHDADGHQYASMYAHLEAIDVSDGQHVSQGQQIGELGRSCEGSLECGSFSTPHVHFSIHRDSGFGGTGSGGSYGGRAVIPEPVDGYSNIEQWDDLISNNGGGGGDDDDASDDDDDASGDDCLIDPHDINIIEEDGPCAALVGADLLQDTGGNGGHAFFTTKDSADPDYAAGVNWMMEFPAAGDYDIWAYATAGLTNVTADADYKVFHAGSSSHAAISQADAPGTWVHLGTFAFVPGGDQWVRLGDNYRSADDQGRTVIFDALKVVSTEYTTGDDDDAMDDDDTTGDDDGTLGPPGGGNGDEPTWECGCSTPAGRPHGPLTTIALLIVATTIRRRIR
jgi:hypothetical protein